MNKFQILIKLKFFNLQPHNILNIHKCISNDNTIFNDLHILTVKRIVRAGYKNVYNRLRVILTILLTNLLLSQSPETPFAVLNTSDNARDLIQFNKKENVKKNRIVK